MPSSSAFASIPQVLAALKGVGVWSCSWMTKAARMRAILSVPLSSSRRNRLILCSRPRRRGLLCAALSAETCDRLQLYPQAARTTPAPAGHGVFTISVDAHPAPRDHDRRLGDGAPRPRRSYMLGRQGHGSGGSFPGPGIFFRYGRGRGASLNARGRRKARWICAGSRAWSRVRRSSKSWPKTAPRPARLPELEKFCKKHDLLLCTIADLIEYRLQQDCLIRRLESLPIDLPGGRLLTCASVRNGHGDPLVHIALCCGGVGEIDPATKKPSCRPDPVLVRMHSGASPWRRLRAHGTHSEPRNCIARCSLYKPPGKGAVVYLRQESRGSLAPATRDLNQLRKPRPSSRRKRSLPVRLCTARDSWHWRSNPPRLGVLSKPRILTNQPQTPPRP